MKCPYCEAPENMFIKFVSEHGHKMIKCDSCRWVFIDKADAEQGAIE